VVFTKGDAFYIHNGRKYTGMRELREGIFKTLKGMIRTSIGRAFIYTVGHIVIAMTCNRLITGAEWALAGLDAIIEPTINGVWYYALDKIFTRQTQGGPNDNS